MDYSAALSFVFRDREWLRKLAIGGFLTFFCFISGVFLIGYYVEVLRCCLTDETQKLPEWSDVGKLFVDGVLGSIIILIYFLTIGGLCALAIVTLSTSPEIPTLEMVLGIIAVSLMTLFSMMIFINIGLLQFAQTNNFGAAFNLVEILSVFKKYFQDLLGITTFVLILQAILLCAGMGILSPFTMFWGWLVQAHLFTQSYKKEQQVVLAAATT